MVTDDLLHDWREGLSDQHLNPAGAESGCMPSRHPRPAFQGAGPAGARRIKTALTLGS
jgi:hypothetical protein